MRFLSSKTHTIIELIVGVALIFAPQLFGFSDNVAASMVAFYVGIFVILSELVTTSPISLAKLVPMNIHLAVDYIAGIFLALSPWIFAFNNAPVNAWLPHVIVGILIIGYALVTNPAADVVERRV